MWQKKRIDKVTRPKVFNEAPLTLIRVGVLGVCFAVGRGVKLSCQQLVRITL